MQPDAFVDGFLLAVPDANSERHRQIATFGAQAFRRHGAAGVVECWGEDMPEGKLTSMPMAVKLEAGESVVFARVVWPSRELRDAGMKAVMEGPHMHLDIPFDGKRMIFGGFRVLVRT